MILETKGQQTRQDEAKWGFLDRWIEAVNQHSISDRHQLRSPMLFSLESSMKYLAIQVQIPKIYQGKHCKKIIFQDA